MRNTMHEFMRTMKLQTIVKHLQKQTLIVKFLDWPESQAPGRHQAIFDRLACCFQADNAEKRRAKKKKEG